MWNEEIKNYHPLPSKEYIGTPFDRSRRAKSRRGDAGGWSDWPLPGTLFHARLAATSGLERADTSGQLFYKWRLGRLPFGRVTGGSTMRLAAPLAGGTDACFG